MGILTEHNRRIYATRLSVRMALRKAQSNLLRKRAKSIAFETLVEVGEAS